MLGKHAIKFIDYPSRSCCGQAGNSMEGIKMIFERVREIICSQLDLDEDRVTMDSNILEDFDADRGDER